MMRILRLSSVALVLLCAACEKAPEKPAAPTAQAVSSVPPAAAPTGPVPPLPADQKALVDKVVAAQGDDAALQALCEDFQKNGTFTGWVVKVTDFSTSTVNSSIDVVLDAGPHVVRLEQVIQTSDPAYKTVEALRIGQMVKLSGQFTHGNGECGYRLRNVNVKITSAEVVG